MLQNNCILNINNNNIHREIIIFRPVPRYAKCHVSKCTYSCTDSNSNRENKRCNFKFLRDGGSCHHVIAVNSNRKNIFYTATRYQHTWNRGPLAALCTSQIEASTPPPPPPTPLHLIPLPSQGMGNLIPMHKGWGIWTLASMSRDLSRCVH